MVFRRSYGRKWNKLHQEDEGNCLNQSSDLKSDDFSVNCMHPPKTSTELMKNKVIFNSKY